jgi:hypothetical protein
MKSTPLLLLPFLSLTSSLPAPDPPKTTIAGVQVLHTPLIQAAIQYSQNHSDAMTHKHVMRSWLFSALITSHNDTLAAQTDPQVLALGTLLHDLGWDESPDSPISTMDRRFEVDGAIAARKFIRSHPDGARMDEKQVQLVWDAIALHTEHQIANHKEMDVQAISMGIEMDFQGPSKGVTKEEHGAVLRAFPADDLMKGIQMKMDWLCKSKPKSTYGKRCLCCLQ